MSSFITSKNVVIDAVNEIYDADTQGLITRSELAKRLHKMNREAVAGRYSEPAEKAFYSFKESDFDKNNEVSAEQTVQSLRCLHYQCSECPVIHTPFYKWLDHKLDAIERILKNHYGDILAFMFKNTEWNRA